MKEHPRGGLNTLALEVQERILELREKDPKFGMGNSRKHPKQKREKDYIPTIYKMPIIEY